METYTQRTMRELAEEIGYDPEGEGSVDDLIGYKDACEDRCYLEGATLDRINAILSTPSWSVGMLEDIAFLVRCRRPELNPDEIEVVLGGEYLPH